jgi:hypothetical protein
MKHEISAQNNENKLMFLQSLIEQDESYFFARNLFNMEIFKLSYQTLEM